MAESLEALIAARCRGELGTDPAVVQLTDKLQVCYGAALQAIVLYGSFRRGETDSLIDLYVFVEDEGAAVHPRWQRWLGRLVPPNVYYLEAGTGVRAKYALLSLARFEQLIDGDFHSYFWGRFAQPCEWVWLSGDAAARLARIQAKAVARFLNAARDAVPAPASARELWLSGLRQSYQAELRAESGDRAETLLDREPAYYETLARALALQSGWPVTEGRLHFPQDLQRGRRRWRLRRWLGKLLSVLRLLKASLTFRGGFDYLLWKIHRHSGIYIEPTPLQRKYPLLFGWPLFWRLYRLGAFR